MGRFTVVPAEKAVARRERVALERKQPLQRCLRHPAEPPRIEDGVEAGADWRTNPSTQIKWGLGYIKNRPDCGSPAAAYSKWLSRSPHWYDDGGYLPEGLSLVANGTGRPEPVFTGSQWDTLRANAGRGGSQPPNITVENHVWVGNREITDIVDHRIEVHDADTGRALAAGRYI